MSENADARMRFELALSFLTGEGKSGVWVRE
jgi:hypothetical protein